MKVFNYIILTLGMLFLLHIAGVDTGSTLLNIVGLNEERGLYIDSSEFYDYLACCWNYNTSSDIKLAICLC